MEALKASYASSSDEEDDYSDTQAVPQKKPKLEEDETKDVVYLPPPPLDALDFPSNLAYKNDNVGNRIRSFPHVEGNYALHVFIPVNIPSVAKKELAPLMKKAAMLVPELYAIDTDLPVCSAQTKNKDGDQVEGVALANQYHISLSRTVAIRVHQIDSIVTILRHKLHGQKRYWIEFGKWEVFINDDQTRSFLAMEVTAEGLSEDYSFSATSILDHSSLQHRYWHCFLTIQFFSTISQTIYCSRRNKQSSVLKLCSIQW